MKKLQFLKRKRTIKKKTKSEKKEPKAPKKEKIDKFIEDNKKYFGITNKPICNFVPTFNKDMIFGIERCQKIILELLIN